MAEAEGNGGPRQVAVIGAGIIGICCALYLQRDGHQVTVLDPQPPGEGCSRGNSGIFALVHCVPDSTPGLVWQVPGMMLDPLGPLIVRPSYLLKALPWLLRFLAASRRGPFEAGFAALYAMTQHALVAYQPLVESAGAQDMVRKQGWLLVFESDESFAKEKPYKVDMSSRAGIRLEVLDGKGARELEPALSPSIRHGVFYPEVAHSTDPFRFVQVLAEDFRRKGGTILAERVTGFEMGPRGPTVVHTEAGRHTPDSVVLAAGAYSKPLARMLGSRIPLDTERGYHAMLPDPRVSLKVPVMSGDFHCALTPMAEGLRVGGSVEFAGVHAAPNYARVDKLVSVGHRVLPGLNDAGHTRWMGCRPSLPDSLPVVSRSPRYPNVYFAFGHGQVGLTNAGITGKLIAELMAGRPTTIDTTPYRADRF